MAKLAQHTLAGKLLGEIGTRDRFCISPAVVNAVGSRNNKTKQETESVVVLVQTTGTLLRDVNAQVPADNPWSAPAKARSPWYLVETRRVVRGSHACHLVHSHWHIIGALVGTLALAHSLAHSHWHIGTSALTD